MKLRKSRGSRKGRIEIIPMIDVMFFLLATFMLASLTMLNLHSLGVHLPKGKAAPLRTVSHTVTLSVTKAGEIYLDMTPVKLETLAAALRKLMPPQDHSLIINADQDATHGLVVQAMMRARTAGVQRFLIAIKHV